MSKRAKRRHRWAHVPLLAAAAACAPAAAHSLPPAAHSTTHASTKPTAGASGKVTGTQPVTAAPAGFSPAADESYRQLKTIAARAVERRTHGTVVYAQMGGYAPPAASVMVVVQLPDKGAIRTLDVRLAHTASGWRFDHIADSGGHAIPRPGNLPADATAVLDNPRIVLADSARWDIYAGRISPRLLSLMEQIAQRTPFAVTVLETGHPLDVFGTTHRSAHSSGMAMDIYALDGRTVVSQSRAHGDAYRLARWLMTNPLLSQLGSPWDFDGPSRKSFTNGVHLDHLHVAV
jgi:hypothetical protein